MTLPQIRREVCAHPANDWAGQLGYGPVYAASAGSRIVVISQAPGRQAQESGLPWNDASGVALRAWLGVNAEQFYDPDLFALIPMDFYYPGKGTHGDLPPRAAFAPLWHQRILAELIDARVTLLVGSYAQRYYLGAAAKRTLTQTVRDHQEYLPTHLPLVHPSPLNFRWRKQNPWFESDVLPVLQSVVSQALSG